MPDQVSLLGDGLLLTQQLLLRLLPHCHELKLGLLAMNCARRGLYTGLQVLNLLLRFAAPICCVSFSISLGSRIWLS